MPRRTARGLVSHDHTVPAVTVELADPFDDPAAPPPAAHTRNPAACRDRFAATNTRTHRTKAISVRTPCKVVYRHAELGATLVDISGTWQPPANNVRLWKLENTAIASYNSTRGTICGPWPAERHLAAPVITVRMIPSGLSVHCRDFGVLLKGRG